MNGILSLVLYILTALSFSLHSHAATIKIDIDRKIGEIDPKIYGVFMEPIHFDPKKFGIEDAGPGNTLYGTLYDPESPLANKDGFKKNYIEACRELKITNMRWPGGNYVAGYNWQDGIGPKEKRPVRKELAWGALDNNHVGTDEWVKLNKALGTENVVCINLGTGTIDDARYWVEYCNSKTGSYYADLRAKYGNETPYNIRYWCLGNEVDGEPWIMGYKNAEDYCKIAKEAAKVMRYTDNTILLVANGSSYYEPSGKWMDWNRKVLTELRDVADYLSIHRYWEMSEDYYVYMGQRAIDIEEKITLTAAQIEGIRKRYKMEKPIYISFDEWAPHGRGLLSTLAVAQYLNSFIRHADVVKMANYTLLTSLLENDREKGTFKTPLFYTFKSFSNNCLGMSVDVFVECETFDTSTIYKDIPYLDVTSVYSEDKELLIINVVNRHKDEAIVADIISSSGTFSGKASISEINRNDIYANYTFNEQEQYIPVTKELTVNGNKMVYSFPAHSFTQIKVKIDR
jgi:alpha-N-arabinofuranosidase